MKKISIIVPCYNVEEYLRQCLDSIVNQTYTNLEIICVNDGSTDNTLSILNEYALSDKRIVIIDQENMGASQARNKALKVATGDYIAFVDGDDWIEEIAIEKAIEKITELNCDLVFWSYNKCYIENIFSNHIYGTEEKILFGNSYADFYKTIFGLTYDQLSKPELLDSICTIWGKLYRKELIGNIQFVDLQTIGTFEDGLFNIQCLNNGKRAFYIPECLYNYRKDNATSITTKYKQDLFENWCNLYKIVEDFIEKNRLDFSFKKALNNRIALSIIGLGLNELANPKGPISQIKNIHKFLKSKRYKEAYKNLEFKYLPAHWKIFLFFAKYNISIAVFIILKAINLLKGKVK